MKQFLIDYRQDKEERKFIVIAESREEALNEFKKKTGLSVEDILVIVRNK